METNDREILNLFIGDVNRNMGNIGTEMNNLSNTHSKLCEVIKQLRDSINMNRVRSNILKEIKLDISKLQPKKKSLLVLDKIEKYLYEDYDI